jgi:uncharacterized protein (DUF433 family)
LAVQGLFARAFGNELPTLELKERKRRYKVSDAPFNYTNKSAQGGWQITGTRVSLDSIVHAYWTGRLPEVIAADFPTLTLEQVHGAIAFYLHNRKEIDGYLAEQDRRWRQFQQESAASHGALLQRVRSAGAATTPAS